MRAFSALVGGLVLPTIWEHFYSSITPTVHISALCMMFYIVGQVASLTPVSEVFEITILGRVVKMAGREDNSAASNRMFIPIRNATVRESWRTLAAIPAPLSDLFDNLFPVIRIPFPVFRSNRH